MKERERKERREEKRERERESGGTLRALRVRKREYDLQRLMSGFSERSLVKDKARLDWRAK